ncbi:copper ABC transporter periplasmic binding protein NosD [Bradyrhizobium oligotrophicum S58]|uniref:Copper ABC transporter periplasmic binding protein NosD n=1 Tax=Bradyrhizobium oligotrophicum S58 TaxID=1245469 RepID=M5A0W7_9BRAD|nr:nitrous oxide reductase family maturation protein NosD [Bradyrhizobium oligotrophicum]BAM92460.1 copper ABC transporter periplasmic binding protein NosD [Bradyrhizobium oligotrophicum S58]
MRRTRHIATFGLAAVIAASLPLHAPAATLQVAAGANDLQAVLDRAAEGDEITLAAGSHRGPLRIGHRLTLTGAAGASITGDGQSSVITVAAPGTIIRGLAIKGSGHSLERMDSGIYVEDTAHDTLIENNEIEGNLFGVYLHGSANTIVRHNSIIGLRATRAGGTGNGVSVWNAPGAKVIDNEFRYGRDGVFAITSRNNVFSGNRFSDLRFAVHFMYTNDSEISGNVSARNIIGYAMMFSKALVVKDNVSDHDRDRGMLFNAANGSQISGNSVIGGLQPAERWATAENRGADEGVPQADTSAATLASGARPGPEKCVFIYNTNNNRISDNWFEACEIGVHFTAGSEGNDIRGNAFVNNASQIKYVGTRHLDWSKNGRGNYWSDNPAFDLNGDGVADTAYRPNDLIDRVLWTAPAAKVLINSPAVQVIRWAQAQFPAILPGGVVDSHPLMSPPARRTAAEGKAR